MAGKDSDGILGLGCGFNGKGLVEFRVARDFRVQR